MYLNRHIYIAHAKDIIMYVFVEFNHNSTTEFFIASNSKQFWLILKKIHLKERLVCLQNCLGQWEGAVGRRAWSVPLRSVPQAASQKWTGGQPLKPSLLL